MRAKYIRALILAVFWISCLPFQTASADMGPKPSMDFTFTQGFPGTQVSIVSGTMFECQQSDCSDAKTLMEAGPQHFGCEATSCRAQAYGFSDYHRLEIQFSDGKTRQSNVFKTADFNGTYKVTIRQDDLLVEPQISLGIFSPLTYILLCGCCLLGVLVIVVVVVIVIVIVRRKSKQQ
jgi:hypothetical protein